MSPHGLIVAAASSGSGKTTITLALARALTRRGIAVSPFKTGPDFIDPAFLSAAARREARNLDPWAMRPETIAALACPEEAPGLTLVEGVMGLFDGAAGGGGSTADLAAMTGWPVLLVVDVRGQSQSVAALVRGFASHRPDVKLGGILLNRTGSERHVRLIAEALEVAGLGLPLLGALPRAAELALPERHLGLVQAGEHPAMEAFLEQAADLVEAHVDVPAVTALGRVGELRRGHFRLTPPGQRIAVAADTAFAFLYPHLAAAWRGAGAELLPFSPLADEAPDADADAVMLPGGYPELHAGRLASAEQFRAGLHATAARGAAVYGECGGYMVLGEALIDADGHRHAMTGLLPLVTSFSERRRHLGYRRFELLADCALGRRGQVWRGHEFHYATIVSEDVSASGAARPFLARDATGRELGPAGLVRGRVAGSFLHAVDPES